MNVLLNFSQDTEVREDQWVLILEDDVALHPSVPPHRLGDIITAGLQQAGRMLSPFMYLGICSPSCNGPELTLTTAHGTTTSFRAVCGGFCTHAYAVQKFMAGRIPDYLRLMQGKQRTIDQALFRFATALNMSLLGSSLKSRDIRSAGSVHAGVFYMKAFSDSLTVGDWELKPKVVFRLGEWSGRLGNLMFEWASVTALAARAGHETQAHFVVTNYFDTPECPAGSFFRNFRLQRFSRDAADLRELRPKCTLHFEETGPNIYKEDAVTKLFSEIKSIEDQGSGAKRCRLLEVYVHGYLQSYKYFQGQTDVLRRAFSPPVSSKTKADTWLKRLRTRLEDRSPGTKWYLVGVQVRRGDKVNNPSFSAIYAPTEWSYYRTGMRILSERLLRKRSNAKVAFVVTSGGSMGSNSQDLAETKEALGAEAKGQTLVFAEGTDVYTDYAVLASMDGIVISASSFGWWAAYISPAGHARGLVVAPRWVYKPTSTLAQGFRSEDYYPPNWEVMNNTGK